LLPGTIIPHRVAWPFAPGNCYCWTIPHLALQLANHHISRYPIKKTSLWLLSRLAATHSSSNRNHQLRRPTLSRTRIIKEAVPNMPLGQGKPSLQQFQLRVDGQTKDSFATFETAEKAGVKIKTAHPVVQVSVYDSVKAAKTIISA
jgi:hypothetical protein